MFRNKPINPCQHEALRSDTGVPIRMSSDPVSRYSNTCQVPSSSVNGVTPSRCDADNTPSRSEAGSVTLQRP